MYDFNNTFNNYKIVIDNELDSYLSKKLLFGDIVREAAHYSVSIGGKRIRPILCLAFADMFGIEISNILHFACAIEMIHTFSLIHDDLPGMDDDDYRRGNPTCHKVYGEGIAVLAGDALLNMAYEVALKGAENSEQLQAVLILSDATGIKGMIGGQAVDITSENKTLKLDELENMHLLKTGALINAPVSISAIIGKVDNSTKKLAKGYAQNIGLAFQIKDDILDVTAGSEILGKTPGKDVAAKKSTYVSLLGVDKANNYLIEKTNAAKSSLEELSALGYNTRFLQDLSDYLLTRKN